MDRVPAVAVEAQLFQVPDVISVAAPEVKEGVLAVQKGIPQDTFHRQGKIAPPNGSSVPLNFRLWIAEGSHRGTGASSAAAVGAD